jgi:hypothetical protein
VGRGTETINANPFCIVSGKRAVPDQPRAKQRSGFSIGIVFR